MMCGSCQHSHLTRCVNKSSTHYGKNTCLVPSEIVDCFEERLIFSENQEINTKELEEYELEMEYERQETREYYDMSGDGTYVYKIGYLQEQH